MPDKSGKPTVLRGLKIKSVSVVDQGANQHAHIKLAKRADDEAETIEAQEQTESGGAAFFERIGRAVAKMLHLNPVEDGEAIEKGDAKTFADTNGSREARELVWRLTEALSSSLFSIIEDKELEDSEKADMIRESAEQAAQAIKDKLCGMFGKEPLVKRETEEPAAEHVSTNGEAENKPETDNAESGVKKGDEKDMRFNLEAMSAEEKKQLEDLQKRFGITDDAQDGKTDETDIYKGVNPAVMAELEALKKFRDDAENAKALEVAKRYAILGKKPEELAPVLKSMKDAGGDAYDTMIATLDSAVAAIEKSGVFGEVGKRGGQETSGSDDAWAKIEVAADEIMKSNHGMSRAEAIDKACGEHPDLLEAYENGR